MSTRHVVGLMTHSDVSGPVKRLGDDASSTSDSSEGIAQLGFNSEPHAVQASPHGNARRRASWASNATTGPLSRALSSSSVQAALAGAFESAGLHAFGRGSGSRTSDQLASLQPKLLKQINSYHNKEDLLCYVSSCLNYLDDINLVTCIYRLARIFASVKNLACRMVWTSELLGDATFQTLLGTLHAHVLQAQMQLLHGGHANRFDARCISNLVWAVVKLEIPMEPGDLGYELLQAVSPLALQFLRESSSQGLANLLWAYSKMPVPFLQVIMLIVQEMTSRLDSDVPEFDAQALSNSIWALAHIRGRVADFDEQVGGPALSVRFMLGIATCTLSMLGTIKTQCNMIHIQPSLADAERQFSCQALVNICWSFASMLGEDCHKIPAIHNVFLGVRKEALLRLTATATAMQLNQPWVFRLQGGFNEQALSNIVYAFDKAQLLDRELLQLVYMVAVFRLDRCSGQLSFKPQELCTLLRAAQSNTSAQPWLFLDKLQRMVVASPRIVQSWTASESAELERALALLNMWRLTLALQQQQVQQQNLAMQYLPHAGARQFHLLPQMLNEDVQMQKHFEASLKGI